MNATGKTEENGNREFRFVILLLSLCAAILLPPYFYGAETLKWVWEICISLVMLAALYSTAERQHARIWLVVFLVPAFLTSWLPLFSEARAAVYADNLTTIFYFSLVSYHLGRYILKTAVITSNVIYAALCLYMIAAVIWGAIYNLQYIHHAASFSFSSEALTLLADNPETSSSLFTYFSFVTLTTLGYGDVVPLTPATQAWVAVQAMFGQFYLAVTIARLVSSYSSPGEQQSPGR